MAPRITGYLICEHDPNGHPAVRERHARRTARVRAVAADRYGPAFVVVEAATEDGFEYTRDGERYERPLEREATR